MNFSVKKVTAILLATLISVPASVFADKVDAVHAYLPGIVCWGDSLTSGYGGQGVTFPNVLKKCIRQKLIELGVDEISSNIEVINMGACAETSATITARNGAIPFVLARGLELPSEPESIAIQLETACGNSVNPLRVEYTGMKTVTIGDICGKLIIEQESPKSDDFRYFFIRDKSGEAVTLPAGTILETEASHLYRHYLPILFIGTNGGYADVAELIEQQKAILAHQQMANYLSDRFLIIGLHIGSDSDYVEMDQLMEETYGRHFINLHEYMPYEALDQTDIEPSASDYEYMALGMTPPSLLSDMVHFNALGYELLGKLVFDRIEELGWFKEIEAAQP